MNNSGFTNSKKTNLLPIPMVSVVNEKNIYNESIKEEHT